MNKNNKDKDLNINNKFGAIGISPWRIAFHNLRKDKLAMVGLFLISLVILVAISAPLLTTHGRDFIETSNSFHPPSSEHWLGTDDLGRDTYTRLIYGTRVSMLVGIVSTSIAVIIGVFLGAIGGYKGGITDMVIMRIVDIFMCFPFFLIAIVVAAILGPSIWNVIIISGLLSWTNLARIVRAEVMTLKNKEFIEASRALGLSSNKIILKHVLPNITSPIIVYSTLGIARGILIEAGLSYLGLGVKQPVPSWGNMLSAAQSFRSINLHWWLWIPPGIMVFLTVMMINFLGDGLRDAFDPKLNK